MAKNWSLKDGFPPFLGFGTKFVIVTCRFYCSFPQNPWEAMIICSTSAAETCLKFQLNTYYVFSFWIVVPEESGAGPFKTKGQKSVPKSLRNYSITSTPLTPPLLRLMPTLHKISKYMRRCGNTFKVQILKIYFLFWHHTETVLNSKHVNVLFASSFEIELIQ